MSNTELTPNKLAALLAASKAVAPTYLTSWLAAVLGLAVAPQWLG